MNNSKLKKLRAAYDAAAEADDAAIAAAAEAAAKRADAYDALIAYQAALKERGGKP